MGAYLYFKTNKERATEVAEFLEFNKTNNELGDEGIFINTQAGVDWAKENNPAMVDYQKNKIGKGEIKTSGVESRGDNGFTPEEILEKQTLVFEELNKRYEMKYFANSCALTLEEHYFTMEQMKRFTQNGKLLSGKTSTSDRARELYEIYYAAFSELEIELFDISIIRDKDTVLVDGLWREVEYVAYQDKYRLCYVYESKYKNTFIDDIKEHIKGHRRYVPKIRYGGSVSDVEAYIKDAGTLIYLETAGQEYMVKSITSVLMQGRTKMNDTTIDASFGFSDINKAGNRRKLTNLDDGLAHSILYHSPSISDTNFSVLIGRDNDELLTSFSAWLEKSQPLPYPKELTKDIYTKLQDNGKLESLISLNIEAVKVDLSILEEECHDLQEIIIEVCKEHNLIDANVKPLKFKAPLPISPLLTPKQVQKIYDTLSSMPKTYELEDIDIKPIGLKLFNSNMTLYITEADSGSPDDEFTDMHMQCFGYVENLSHPSSSEFGYINVGEYIRLGFEMDLYFKNQYIDNEGNVGSESMLKERAA